MKSQYVIRELVKNEPLILLKDKRFNTLHPIKCSACDNKDNFSRRLFIVEVEPKNVTEDERQPILMDYLLHRYQIQSAFFKNSKKKNYIDTSICEKCHSTAIIYDIKFDSAMIDEIFKNMELGDDKKAEFFKKFEEKMTHFE